jgi:hypothetical protein
MKQPRHSVRFAGAPDEYRQPRNELLEAEIEDGRDGAARARGPFRGRA